MEQDIFSDTATTARSPPRRPGYVDYMLIVLSDAQRIPLLTVLSVVVVLSLCGNVATIVVNVRRPIRPFYRTCLLSLACGDLISTIFQSSSYVAQLASVHPPVWTLGAFMCGAVPFLTTWAVLVNSFVLVAIALDRYVAVGKVWSLARAWEPRAAVCTVLAVAAWGLSAAIAVPTATRYEIVDVFIIETNPENRTQQIDVRPAQMCQSDKSPNFSYYAAVFSVIYLPLVLAFLWLNGVIAVEIWRRRRPIRSPNGAGGSRKSVAIANATTAPPSTTPKGPVGDQDDPSMSGKRTTETGTNSMEISGRVAATPCDIPGYPSAKQLRKRSSREIRQLRMFRAILCVMCVFLVCRLPSWCYLLYKLRNPVAQPGHWVLQYSLGILSLVSCVVNPLLYTFLAETIDTSFAVLDRLRACVRCSRCETASGRDEEQRSGNADLGPAIIRPTQFYCSEDRKEKLARVD